MLIMENKTHIIIIIIIIIMLIMENKTQISIYQEMKIKN